MPLAKAENYALLVGVRDYQSLIFAHELNDDIGSADEVMREAKFRYPRQEFLRYGEGERIILQYDDRQEF